MSWQLGAGFPSLQSLSLAWPGAVTENATWRQLVKELNSLRLMLYWPLLHVRFFKRFPQAFRKFQNPLIVFLRTAYNSAIGGLPWDALLNKILEGASQARPPTKLL